MERIQEVKITVYIETNKTTYRKEFDSLKKVQEYLKEIFTVFEID